jgi:hypothetical protein
MDFGEIWMIHGGAKHVPGLISVLFFVLIGVPIFGIIVVQLNVLSGGMIEVLIGVLNEVLILGLIFGLSGGLIIGWFLAVLLSSNISPSELSFTEKASFPGIWSPSWTTPPSGYSCAKSAEAMSSSTGC